MNKAKLMGVNDEERVPPSLACSPESAILKGLVRESQARRVTKNSVKLSP
jgi:hypothetical protein